MINGFFFFYGLMGKCMYLSNIYYKMWFFYRLFVKDNVLCLLIDLYLK